MSDKQLEIVIEERKNMIPDGKPYYYGILRRMGQGINAALTQDKNLMIDMLTEYAKKEFGEDCDIKIHMHQKIEDQNIEE